MSTSTVNGIGAYQAANTYETKKKETDTIVESQKAQSTATAQNSSSGFSDTAAVYEPSSKIDRVMVEPTEVLFNNKMAISDSVDTENRIYMFSIICFI